MVGQPIASTAYDPDRKGLAMFPTNFTDLEWLVKRCAMPVVVKGVLRGDDARRCVDCGVKGIMVSNHGGRHLDTTVTTAEVISEIVEAVGKTAEVYVDGGIRRGTDIVKALALGARAVLLGRPPLWGLSVAGADGVAAVMEHMHDEMVRAMQLCGAAQPRGADAGSGEAVKELIPTGKLRVGVAFAPSASPLFVVKDADGAPRGVTVDLGQCAGARARRRRSSSWSRRTPASWSMRWRRAGSTCRSCRSTTSARSGSTSARSISWSRAPTW